MSIAFSFNKKWENSKFYHTFPVLIVAELFWNEKMAVFWKCHRNPLTPNTSVSGVLGKNWFWVPFNLIFVCQDISYIIFFFWLQLWKTKKTNTISKFKNSPGEKYLMKRVSSISVFQKKPLYFHKIVYLCYKCVVMLHIQGPSEGFRYWGTNKKKGHLWCRNIP